MIQSYKVQITRLNAHPMTGTPPQRPLNQPASRTRSSTALPYPVLSEHLRIERHPQTRTL